MKRTAKIFVVALSLVRAGVACTTSTPAPGPASAVDAATPPPAPTVPPLPDAPREDAALAADSGEDAAEGGEPTRDASARDASGPGVEDTSCSFNDECRIDLRCDEDKGFVCAPGARGTVGFAGPCDSSNDCSNAVCLEGPDGGFFCSDRCVDEKNCQEPLPLCSNVAFLGKVCIRRPPP